ncbi:MAG: 50S ribosomal protein L11 methyltransferase [Sandaracinaceae bacterium]|nr:50S ribosomal protein L11 methyltransferase [Sandaracinaceae bacterium]
MTAPPRYPIVRVHVAPGEVDAVSGALFELGATGVEERDGSTMDRVEGGGAELVAHFDDEASARDAADALAPREAAVDFIVGDDWKERWKEFFEPARVGERFVVRPPWREVEAGPLDHVIVIDPGQAFGTGTHETTRLVLREIERVGARGDVLDVGCGSGILAIGARLAGAARAVAIDVDPIAVRATLENAEVNGVPLEASTTDVADVPGAFDLVLANIRAPVLVPMAPLLVARTRGHLILSGLLVEERDEVRAAYDPLLAFEHERVDGDWLALTYRRPA